MKTFLLSLFAAFLIFAGLNYLFSGSFNLFEMPQKNVPKEISAPIGNANDLKSAGEENQPQETLAKSLNLSVPFITQAPFGDWSYPFNHTCEEAAVLMAHYYLSGKTKVDPSQTKKELLDIVDFEIKNYGFHEDTSASQTAQFIEDYYGYNTKLVYDISLNDIKKELNRGNPVIVPTAGRLLHNPNFTPPGPLYHMLLVKGYTQKEFITNDPGTTKTGADRRYSYKILENALHDWNGGDVINGKRVMIIVSK